MNSESGTVFKCNSKKNDVKCKSHEQKVPHSQLLYID